MYIVTILHDDMLEKRKPEMWQTLYTYKAAPFTYQDIIAPFISMLIMTTRYVYLPKAPFCEEEPVTTSALLSSPLHTPHKSYVKQSIGCNGHGDIYTQHNTLSVSLTVGSGVGLALVEVVVETVEVVLVLVVVVDGTTEDDGVAVEDGTAVVGIGIITDTEVVEDDVVV